MKIEAQSINNISKAILGEKSTYIWLFTESVLDNLDRQKDKENFEVIWRNAISFDNWNFSDLNDGHHKTVEILKKIYNLENEVALKIANAAAYQWK